MSKTIIEIEEDLVRYAYGETTAEENQYLEVCMQNNTRLRDFYSSVLESIQELDELLMEPSDKMLNNILAFSEHFSSETVLR